ncbi:hypothetical protein PHLGIDRAFT_121576 [Phlebiopsis gigantea 11061_1 CR5-6]|uniref:Uncharacterized protein n=1 Tax=Phlebiopsis gigantea (strain 11061_1 CR5-6) TaxID=745531 RepID=A0A0C3S1Y5_PHLG1|nr:hypothetical protein PHLGIDRAFT_121576 [Phlebiopsis gigantea 11061_1 CR5-6]
MTFHVIRINSIYCIFQEFYTSSSTNIDDARGQDALVSLVGTIGTGLTWSGSIYASPLFGRGARKRHPHPPRAMTEPTPGPVIPPSEAKRAKEFVTTEY